MLSGCPDMFAPMAKQMSLLEFFETDLGLAVEHPPASYWDIIGKESLRVGVEVKRKNVRRRKTAAGVHVDGTGPRPRHAGNGGGGNGPSG